MQTPESNANDVLLRFLQERERREERRFAITKTGAL
jgi:hypothetical protein